MLRRVLSAVVVFAMVALASLAVGSGEANATSGTNDYPYKNSAIDVSDGWGFLTRECTSFVAWRIRNDIGISDFTNGWKGGWFGNASNWAANARALGVPVDTNATVGSVAQFPPGVDGAGSNGHVAYVLSVSSSTVTVEDYNYADNYDGNTYYNYSQHTVSRSGLNFIHFSGSKTVNGTVEAQPTLNVRSGPGTGYSIVGTVSYNSVIAIGCYNTGTTVTATWPNGSTWTTAVWDHIGSGYVSDAWVNTGGDTSTMVPHC